MPDTTVQVEFHSTADDEAVTLADEKGRLMIWQETEDGVALYSRAQFEAMVLAARKLMGWDQ